MGGIGALVCGWPRGSVVGRHRGSVVDIGALVCGWHSGSVIGIGALVCGWHRGRWLA